MKKDDQSQEIYFENVIMQNKKKYLWLGPKVDNHSLHSQRHSMGQQFGEELDSFL